MLTHSLAFFHRPWAGLLLALLPFALPAQTPLSLEEALRMGLENNFQIQIAEANLAVARNNNVPALAGAYPSITATANLPSAYTAQNNPASFLQQAEFVNTGANASVDLAWTIFDGHRVRLSKAQLAQLERQGESNARLAVESTMQAIMLAYYQALLQREQVGVQAELLALSRDQINYQRLRQDFGQAGSFDLLQAQDAYLSDSIALLGQQLAYENALRELLLQMGSTELEAGQIVLSEALAVPRADYAFEALNEQMLANNSSLQNLYITRELANIGTRLQENTMQPRVNLGTGLSYGANLFQLFGSNPQTGEPFEARTGQSFSYNLNLTASYTIFDFGLRKRQIESARLQENVAQLNIEALKQNLSQQLRNALATYATQHELLGLAEARLDNARRNVQIAEERLRGGLINSFDFRSVQLTLAAAAQARLAALSNLKLTETQLLFLTGALARD